MASNESVREPRLTGHRVEKAVYLAKNNRGAEVRIGSSDQEGVFSPGELLQLAAAACASLTADHVLSNRLGPDFDASFAVDGVGEQNRYTSIDTQFTVDMSELDPARHEALIERALGAIERLCTVARTLNSGATTAVNLTPDDGRA
ncbi:MAG: OsmC family protein [Propionibacteriaceae bacterium]|nr:OsmC family protein [Propionibacteriaceae bacterium]